MHFGGQGGFRERSLGGGDGVVVIHEFHALTSVDARDTILYAPAKRAGAVKVNANFGSGWHGPVHWMAAARKRLATKPDVSAQTTRKRLARKEQNL